MRDTSHRRRRKMAMAREFAGCAVIMAWRWQPRDDRPLCERKEAADAKSLSSGRTLTIIVSRRPRFSVLDDDGGLERDRDVVQPLTHAARSTSHCARPLSITRLLALGSAPHCPGNKSLAPTQPSFCCLASLNGQFQGRARQTVPQSDFL